MSLNGTSLKHFPSSFLLLSYLLHSLTTVGIQSAVSPLLSPSFPTELLFSLFSSLSPSFSGKKLPTAAGFACLPTTLNLSLKQNQNLFIIFLLLLFLNAFVFSTHLNKMCLWWLQLRNRRAYNNENIMPYF